MPKIKVKSLENLCAAQKLIDCGMYTTSIHCSYYSSFLAMKHFLNNHPNKSLSYADQNSYSGKDSHNYIYDEVIKRMVNSIDIRDLRVQFRKLKADRKRADYSAEQFTDLESLDNIERSKKLQAKLK